MPYAAVVLDLGLDKPLDYAIPSSFAESLKIGARVLVTLRGSKRKGTVIAIKETAEVSSPLPIIEILEGASSIPLDLLKVAEWIARYYCTPLPHVLQTMTPPALRKGTKAKKIWMVALNLSRNEAVALCQELRQKNGGQASVLDHFLQNPKGILLSQLLEKPDISLSPVKTLVKKKALLLYAASSAEDFEYFPTRPKKLYEEQMDALQKIENSLGSHKFHTHLLHGVTGSGKTEIYLQAIQHAFNQGKGALFLVPEIALTAQMIEHLKSRFQEKIAILHHRMSDGVRHEYWMALRKGTIRLAIGARSCLFSPVQNLGLIIVDEEHEPSYKQTEEMPCYNARDVAIMRGKLTNATVVLGSATPSLESRQRAETGKYIYSRLAKRIGSALLPQVSIVDMRLERAKGNILFSETLVEKIKNRLQLGEQTLLFLNRRGYHTAQLCSLCSETIRCPHCELSLTFHRGDNILACHLCDYRLLPPPRECPKCHHGELKYKGVGTEQVERALHALLPSVRTSRADADTTRHKGSHEKIFQQFRSGKSDVLIGTQMIAKGLHFPSVTLVGVLNPDASLQIPDFRASEHLLQILTQVAGRSGRGALGGEVVIQTSLPEHETILFAAKQDDEAFFRKEIDVRKLFDFPPWTHLIKLLFSSKDPHAAQKFAENYRSRLIAALSQDFTITPITPCGHPKIEDRYRFQFLIKGVQPALAARQVRQIALELPPPKDLQFFADVDPLSTFY